MILAVLSFVAACATAGVYEIKFGILRPTPGGGYDLDVETAQIPRLFENTGFRFGVVLSNPGGATVQWYRVVHLPAEPQRLGGPLRKVGPRVVRSEMTRTNDLRKVVWYSFNEGDPLGQYRMEVYINGVREFDVMFDVVEPR